MRLTSEERRRVVYRVREGVVTVDFNDGPWG